MVPLTAVIALSLTLVSSPGESPRQDAVPLMDAIKSFNGKASVDPIGKDQQPLMEEEVIAAVRAWQRSKDTPVLDEMYDAFKQIAENRMLPRNAEFEWETGYSPRGPFVFDMWSVRIRMYRPDRSSYAFELRNRMIRSRTLHEELDHVQKKLQRFLAEERVREKKEEPAIGSWKVRDHLEKYIETLKTRIAEQKAN